MRLDLTDLRLFLHVHAAGTITAGAQDSHMTLASASERIRNMEDSLGVALLFRDRRGVRLTPAGRALVHHARLVLQQMDSLQGELGEYSQGLKGHVRVLCNTSALSEHLPAALGSFLSTHPGISVDLEERESDDIVDAVRGGFCDVGLVSDHVDLAGLEVLPFRPDPLVLVVPRDHAFPSGTAKSLAELVDLAFVGLVPGSALQEHISHHARRLGRQLQYRVRLRSLESVCRLVGEGVGVGIVPKAVAARCAAASRTRRIALRDPWAERNLVLCVRQLDQLSSPAQQLVRHVLQDASPPTPA